MLRDLYSVLIKSAFLWHRRLGHISKKRLKQLEKDGILPALNYDDLNDCIECFKGKLTNKRKLTAVRSHKLLELIHTDICGPFKHKTMCGNVYFITFIDDYSRYCYIYLLSEKSQALEAFKIYKAEVELQLETKIKTVRSDRGGEFYGRHTSAGQQKGPFAMFLQEHGIKAQYSTPYTPTQNGVAERKNRTLFFFFLNNRTLLNMVRSMMCTSGLPINLWGEALKTANYICNRSPSKSVETTPFELWCGRKPSLHHCHVWGCKAEARIPNILQEKLGPKTISCNFIGYCEKSKGYRFYTPKAKTKLMETNQAKFLDEGVCSDNFEDLSLEFDEIVENEAAVQILPLAHNTVHHNTANLNQVNAENLVHDDQLVNAENFDQVENQMDFEPQNAAIQPQNLENPQLRRSSRPRKPVYGENSDYQVYLQEQDVLAEDDDPLSFK